MKKTAKRVVSLALSLVMMFSLTLTAQAAGGDSNYVIHNLNITDGYQLIPQTSAGETDEGVDGRYSQTVKFDFSCTNGTDVQQVVFLLSGGAKVPSENTIRYIDQNTGLVHYNIYPDTLSKTGTYNLYVVNGTDYIKAASFDVKALKPGDVDFDGVVTVSDASLVLQHFAELITLDDIALSVADVDNNSEVGSLDASYILQWVAKIIEQFPGEEN